MNKRTSGIVLAVLIGLPVAELVREVTAYRIASRNLKAKCVKAARECTVPGGNIENRAARTITQDRFDSFMHALACHCGRCFHQG